MSPSTSEPPEAEGSSQGKARKSIIKEVVDRPDLVELSRRLLESLEWRYICSVAFRDAADGEPAILEVNTRMPSTINLPWKAGYNMPLAALRNKRLKSFPKILRPISAVCSMISCCLGVIFFIFNGKF